MKHSERCSRLSTQLKQQIGALEKILPTVGESERLFTLKMQARLADIIGDLSKLERDIAGDKWNMRKRNGVTLSLEMQTLACWIRELRDDYDQNHLHIIVEDDNCEDELIAACRLRIENCCEDQETDYVGCCHSLELAILDCLQKLSLKDRLSVLRVESMGDGNLYLYEEDDDDAKQD